MKKLLVPILKIVVTIGLLAWFLIRSDIAEVVRSMAGLPIFYFLFCEFLILTSVYILSLKWKLFVPDYSSLNLFRLNLIGQYYSLLLPGQLIGEAAKVYIMGYGNTGVEKIAASVIFDKVTGILGLLLIGIIGLFFTSFVYPTVLLYIMILLLFMGSGIILLLRLSTFHQKILQSLRFQWKWKAINKLFKQVELLIEAVNSYTKNYFALIINILLGIVHQLISIVVIVFLSGFFGIDVLFADWCWIMAVLSVALLLPLTVGGIGVREGSLVGLLSLFQIPSEKALALSFTLFALQTVLALIGGILEWNRKKTPVSDSLSSNSNR